MQAGKGDGGANRIGRAAALIGVIAISLFVFSIRDRVEKFAAFGYPGIFLFTLLTYATVILPAPGATVVFAMGAVFNPFWVGVVAGAGAALGELTGYAAGYSGQAVVEKIGLYQRIHTWMKQSRWKTFIGLILFAAVPNPVFDLAGIAAGVLRIPIPRFIAALLIGETIKMLMFAYAGAYSIDWIMRLSR
ncbi:MAG: VTT domain-containing protein [Chloroflexi bacterium]|nr:VTT domain-containing protein [Chloroflexota bacterium]